MPRLAPQKAVEYRLTLGDYERQSIVKPIGSLLKQTDTTIRHTRYLGYAALGGGVLAAWFIGKGIAGTWDDFKDMVPTYENLTDPEGDIVIPWVSPAWWRKNFWDKE